jgi:GGDEF domain-containing protein
MPILIVLRRHDGSRTAAPATGRQPVEYPRFERLIIGCTALVVVLTLAASALSGGSDAAEIVGGLAFIVVAAVAVHWGRKAGTIAALSACLVYLASRLPMLATGLTTSLLVLILSRFAGYCLVGIVGGEVFGRVKYVFAGSVDSDVIDSWSLVYNQRYTARALDQAIERHKRYQEPFSIVVLTLAPSLTETRRPEQLRGLVRTAAGFLRDDVRMVDDVARLEDGRLVVLLPHTSGASTRLVAERLAAGLCKTLGAQRESVTTMCLDASDDAAALHEFAVSITAVPDEPRTSAGVGRVEVGLHENPEA